MTTYETTAQEVRVAPFQPAATVSRAVSTNSANVALSGAGDYILLTNDSDITVFWKTGESDSVTAAVTDTPLLAGATILFRRGAADTHIAAISASGTGTLYATTGQGG